MNIGAPYYNEQGSPIEVDLEFDWKTHPAAVMEEVDKALEQYGLMVVSHNTDSDFYAFSIKRRNDKTN